MVTWQLCFMSVLIDVGCDPSFCDSRLQVFLSDAAVTADGFRLSWELVPGVGLRSGLKGVIPDLTEASSHSIGVCCPIFL